MENKGRDPKEIIKDARELLEEGDYKAALHVLSQEREEYEEWVECYVCCPGCGYHHRYSAKRSAR